MHAFAVREVAQERHPLRWFRGDQSRVGEVDDTDGKLSELPCLWFALGKRKERNPAGHGDEYQQADKQEGPKQQGARG